MTNGGTHGRIGGGKKATAKKEKQKDAKTTLKRRKIVPGNLAEEKNR